MPSLLLLVVCFLLLTTVSVHASSSERTTTTTLTGSAGFGSALTVDGSYLLVGAPSTGTLEGGAAHLYRRSDDSDDWTHVATLQAPAVTPTTVGWEYFGWSVALRESRLVIGAPASVSVSDWSLTPDEARGWTATGSAYVYERTDSVADDDHSWTLVATLQPTVADTETASFGRSVALSDTHVVVGAPQEQGQGAVYLYKTSALSLPPHRLHVGREGALFGQAVALREKEDDDADILLVGAMTEQAGRGALYVYQCPHTAAALPSLVVRHAGSEGDWMGAAVAFGPSQWLVSAPGAAGGRGQVAVYDADSRNLVQTLTPRLLSLSFGSALAVLHNAVLAIGAEGTNQVYLFRPQDDNATTTTVWTEEDVLTPQAVEDDDSDDDEDDEEEFMVNYGYALGLAQSDDDDSDDLHVVIGSLSNTVTTRALSPQAPTAPTPVVLTLPPFFSRTCTRFLRRCETSDECCTQACRNGRCRLGNGNADELDSESEDDALPPPPTSVTTTP